MLFVIRICLFLLFYSLKKKTLRSQNKNRQALRALCLLALLVTPSYRQGTREAEAFILCVPKLRIQGPTKSNLKSSILLRLLYEARDTRSGNCKGHAHTRTNYRSILHCYFFFAFKKAKQCA